jgi:hypothetical protein
MPRAFPFLQRLALLLPHSATLLECGLQILLLRHPWRLLLVLGGPLETIRQIYLACVPIDRNAIPDAYARVIQANSSHGVVSAQIDQFASVTADCYDRCVVWCAIVY